MGGSPCWGYAVCPRRRQCRGGQSGTDRDSLPSDCGAGYIAGRILRRVVYKTKAAHARRNPGRPPTGTILGVCPSHPWLLFARQAGNAGGTKYVLAVSCEIHFTGNAVRSTSQRTVIKNKGNS